MLAYVCDDDGIVSRIFIDAFNKRLRIYIIVYLVLHERTFPAVDLGFPFGMVALMQRLRQNGKHLFKVSS